MLSGKIIEKFKAKDGSEVIIRFLKFEDWEDCLKLINSLVEEDAPILANRKFSKKEEIEWVCEKLKKIENREAIVIVAEVNKRVVGICEVEKKHFRESHIGKFGIGIIKEFRGLGIGERLMRKALELSKKQLKLKMVTLDVFEINKVAMNLYKKLGFKVYGKLPKAFYYKGKYIGSISMYKEL